MNRVINILLVEDDSLDAMDLQRTLDRIGVLYKIKIAKNGEEGIKLLTEDNNPVFSGKPDILLLDLNMPRMNGIEFLQAIRSNEEWKDIKVFVLQAMDQRTAQSTVHEVFQCPEGVNIVEFLLAPV
jgi:CheY-like chemotaxis protein